MSEPQLYRISDEFTAEHPRSAEEMEDAWGTLWFKCSDAPLPIKGPSVTFHGKSLAVYRSVATGHEAHFWSDVLEPLSADSQ